MDRDRKKKREKPLSNGCAATDSQTGGNVHREGEQGSTKKLASVVSSGSPTQPFLPSFNWPFMQHLPAAQHTLPQMHAQATQQQPMTQGSQGGTQTVPGWQNSEAFGHISGPEQHQTGSGDSNWHQPAAGVQGMGAPPPPFAFPPPPYPGLWDPVTWWGHNPYQPTFPYMFPGYGSNYPCPMPPFPPVGPNQRGLIKPPPGLSQKHIRIWEAQSMENVQLWTTTSQLWAAVARADAEISLQRGKILKLEAELQALKANLYGQAPQTEITLQPAARRGRRMKPTPAPPAAVTGLSGSTVTPLQAPGRKARTNPTKVDTTKNFKEVSPTENRKQTVLAHMTEHGYMPHIHPEDNKNCSTTGGNIKDKNGIEKNSLRQKVENQDSTNNVLMGSKEDVSFGYVNIQSNPRSSLTLKVDSCDQNLGMKESTVVSFLKNAANLDHQSVLIGDSSLTAAINRMTTCLESNVYDTPKNAGLGVRTQLLGHCDTNNIEKSNILRLGKAIPNWQYIGEDGSDEQDEAVASAPDDDEQDDDVDEDDEDNKTALGDIHSDKVGNCMILDPLLMKWQ